MPQLLGEVAFGAAISEDRRHGSVVAAGRSESGKILIDLVWYEHPRLMVQRLDGLYVKHDPVDVVINPKAQSVTLIQPLRERGIVARLLSTEDAAVAHGEFLDLVNDGGLEHLSQKPLTDAVRAAQQRPLAGAKAWEPRVETDQGPLVAATGAVFGFLRWEEVSAPGAFAL